MDKLREGGQISIYKTYIDVQKMDLKKKIS